MVWGEGLVPWAIFLLSAAVIVYAGTKLSRYGDQIADLTGLGGLWIGVVVMAGATSLPEIFTTVSAGWLNTPDLAAGNLFGAGMSNMLTLGLIDLLHRQKRVWQQAALGHTLTAALAMALTGLATFFVLLNVNVTHVGVGLGSLTLFLLYVLGMRLVFRQEDMERRQREQDVLVERTLVTQDSVSRRVGLRRAVIGFSLSALALLVVAPLLAWSAERIAEETGTSATFIGTSLVAITTSLPELVVAIAAVRLGDERGTLAYNLVLGERRAQAAERYLEDLGVPASQLQIVSYGKERPFCTEHNEACWQSNRRAHFAPR